MNNNFELFQIAKIILQHKTTKKFYSMKDLYVVLENRGEMNDSKDDPYQHILSIFKEDTYKLPGVRCSGLEVKCCKKYLLNVLKSKNINVEEYILQRYYVRRFIEETAQFRMKTMIMCEYPSNVDEIAIPLEA